MLESIPHPPANAQSSHLEHYVTHSCAAISMQLPKE